MSGSAPGISMFLGDPAAGGGPFALLGIPVAPCKDDVILEALRRRLARIDEHPQSESPLADEVRLALHAAAAQLLDPATRRHLLVRWSSSTTRSGPAAPAGGPSLPPPPAPPARSPSPTLSPPDPPTLAPEFALPSIPRQDLVALEHDAILVLAQQGGWNRESLRKLAMLAHSRGIRSESVSAAVARLTHRRSEPSSESRHEPARQQDALTPGTEHVSAGELPPPGRDVIWPGVLFVTLILAIGIGIASVALFAPQTWQRFVSEFTAPHAAAEDGTETPQAISEPGPEPREQAPPAPSGEPQPAAGPIPDLLSTPSQIIGALSASAQTLGIRAEDGVVRFARALDAFAAGWTDFSTQERAAAQGAVVEFLYRASTDPSLGRRSIEPILNAAAPLTGPGAPLSDNAVERACWGAGMIARLAEERELGPAVQEPVRSALASLSGDQPLLAGDSFDRGLARGLAVAARRLAAQPAGAAEGWRGWIASAAAIDPAIDLTPLMIETLTPILRDGPDPADQRWVYDLLRESFALMDWTGEGSARPWVIGLFDDPAVQPSDLRAVTQLLAASGATTEIDTTMVLPVEANELVIATLRDRFRVAWNLVGQSEEDQLAAMWGQAVGTASADLDRSPGPVGQLAIAAELATLNHAASLRWRGEFDEAARLISEARGVVEAAASAGSQPLPGSFESESGNDWAIGYLEVGNNLSARLALLEELQGFSGPMGPMAAEVLVQEATRGNRHRVRALAHELLQRFLFQPTIINAVLEALPTMPPTRQNLELIERLAGQRLPPDSDPRWPVLARRALVERLLELTAGESDLAVVDRLQSIVARSYAGRLRDSAIESADAPADRLASAVRLEWSQRGSRGGGSLADHPIERRRLARRAIADGPTQAFLVEQLAIVDWMSLVVRRERPEASPAIDSIRRDLDDARRDATSVFEQVAAAEWAIIRLWSVRLNALSTTGEGVGP